MKRKSVFTIALTASAIAAVLLVMFPSVAAQQVVSVDHTDSSPPDGDFEVTVDIDNAATSAVEVSGNGFTTQLSVIDDDGDTAQSASDSRIEFTDLSSDGGTYVLNVDVTGGSDGDTGTVTAYAGGNANENDNDDSVASTFNIQKDVAQVSSVDNPSMVQSNGDFDVTLTTSNAATSALEVSSGFDAELSAVDSDGDGTASPSQDRIEFVDPSGDGGTYVVNVNVSGTSGGETGDILAYAGGNANENDNDDKATSQFSIEDSEDGGTVSPPNQGINISFGGDVRNGGSTEFTVATSAGSTAAVEVDAVGFNASLSVVDKDGDGLGNATDDRIEFIDIQATESTYVLNVTVTDAEAGDTGTVTAYLGGDADENENDYNESTDFSVSDLYTSPIQDVSDELWTEVTGDGNLELGDLGTAIQEYQDNGEINGVTIELGDLGSLIQYYQDQQK